MTSTEPRVFISYRRTDSMGWALAMASRLQGELGADTVFIDADDIEPGDQYPERLAGALASASIVLAVIGIRWMTEVHERSASGQRDWVVHELSTALGRDARVIPVLVERAGMPRSSELPAEIAGLGERHYHEIRGSAHSRDVDGLIEVLRGQLERAASAADPPAQEAILDAAAWDGLTRRIRSGSCVPILGPAVSRAATTATDVLLREAAQIPAALLGGMDLPRLAQAAAVGFDRSYPMEMLAAAAGEAAGADEVLVDRLAALTSVPLYLTTNFDASLDVALTRAGREPLLTEPGRVSQLDGGIGLGAATPPTELTPQNPTVLHLFGRFANPAHMVLTEDDCFDLLVRMSREQGFFDAGIRGHLALSSLLFVGFSLADWRFRLLLRGLSAQLDDTGVASIAVVQLEPDELPDGFDESGVADFVERYFRSSRTMDVRAYLGSAEDFMAALTPRVAEEATGS